MQIYIPFLMEYIGDNIFLEDAVDHLKNEEVILWSDLVAHQSLECLKNKQGIFSG